MIKGLFHSLFGFDFLSNDPAINNPYAKACSPDDLIVAHILESFAKDITEWKITLLAGSYDQLSGYQYGAVLDGPNGLALFLEVNPTQGISKRLNEENGIQSAVVRLDGERVELSGLMGHNIWKAYSKIRKNFDAVQATAAKALADMQAAEKKWNLAERLLGMKRNEFGALVPVVQVEE